MADRRVGHGVGDQGVVGGMGSQQVSADIWRVRLDRIDRIPTRRAEDDLDVARHLGAEQCAQPNCRPVGKGLRISRL